MPLTLVAAALGLELARSAALARLPHGPFSYRWPSRGEVARLLALFVLAGLVVGALRVTNTWDFPIYLGLVALGALIALRPRQGRAGLRGLVGVLVIAGLVFGLTSLLYQPFHDRYRLFYSGAEPSAARTAIWQFLAIHGLPLLLVVSWLLVELGRRSSVLLWANRLPRPAAGLYSVALPLSVFDLPDARWSLLVGIALLMIGLAALGQLTLALCVGVMLGLFALAWLRWSSREALVQVALGLAALGALALPELITIKGDIGRMNTVFKFYFQAWVLLGVLSAVWLTRLASVGSRRADAGPGLRLAWKALLALLVAAVLVYPLRATPLKLGLRFQPSAPSLDGMAYMEQASYKDRERDVGLPDDFAALRWLQDEVEGSPVVLEANTGLYKWGSRVSIYTGLPTVIGWDWHEKQQRVAQAETVEQRLKDVRTMYETPRLEQALPLLRKYGVVYIYVGGLERAYYPAAGLNKFAEAPGDVLETVYQHAGITIYRLKDRPGDAAA